jgi:hypothetical protein
MDNIKLYPAYRGNNIRSSNRGSNSNTKLHVNLSFS